MQVCQKLFRQSGYFRYFIRELCHKSLFSVAKHLRCGEIFNGSFTENFAENKFLINVLHSSVKVLTEAIEIH